MTRENRAWIHHAELDGFALWIVAETKPGWALAHPRDPALPKVSGVDRFPEFSSANIRELLCPVLLLEKLIGGACSTKYRLRFQRRSRFGGFAN